MTFHKKADNPALCRQAAVIRTKRNENFALFGLFSFHLSPTQGHRSRTVTNSVVMVSSVQ